MVTIGLNGTYSLLEDAGHVNIVVLVLMSTLARDVVAILLTVDDTAEGRFVQCLIYVDYY